MNLEVEFVPTKWALEVRPKALKVLKYLRPKDLAVSNDNAGLLARYDIV